MSDEFLSEEDNRVLRGPVLPTFLYYSAAAMLGLVAITTSNLVDGVFVGNYVGSDALAAITLLVPVFTLLFAIALMFAIGGSVAAGKHIGEDDERAASAVFTQTLCATCAMATLFAVSSYAFEGALFGMLGVPDELSTFVSEYFDVIRWVLVIQLTTMVLYYFVRADGYPILATVALVVGAVGNIALDALFVIEMDMGLRGAAYAVLISQVFQAATLALYFRSKERTLLFGLPQVNLRYLQGAMFNGVSEFINEISTGIIFWLLNYLLLARLGVDGVAAFSVVNYCIFLSLMLSYGIADALHLLASQNYGARERARIGKIFMAALGCSVVLGVLLSFVLFVAREGMTTWFVSEEEVAVSLMAEDLVLVIWPLFLVNGTNIILSCYLTAIHRPKPSALIASLRGLILPAGLLVGLSMLFARSAESSDWSFMMALPLAEWATFLLGFWLCYRHRPAALRFSAS